MYQRCIRYFFEDMIMIIRNSIGCLSVLLCCFLFSACENDGGGSDTADYAAPGWTMTDFHTLCTTTWPIVCTPTRAIEFDSQGNLYIENTTDDESGFIDILKLDAASGFSTLPSYFATYSTTYKGATGLDFDGLGSLYVSERSVSGDAGIIREIDVATQVLLGDVMAFADHRPTGVDADSSGNVFYSGRQATNGTWGKLFKIDPSLTRTVLSASTVATGIALDTYGNIFISTPQRTDLALLRNSIYMFRSTDVGLLNPILIATFNQTGGELTFDEAGDLYMIAEDQVTIIKFSPIDTDDDGVGDYMDNCTLVPNPIQRDTDDDGYGNFCDADLNQDLQTDLSDFDLFKSVFGTADPDADFNGDGIVDLSDFTLFRVMLESAPGPSGLNP